MYCIVCVVSPAVKWVTGGLVPTGGAAHPAQGDDVSTQGISIILWTILVLHIKQKCDRICENQT